MAHFSAPAGIFVRQKRDFLPQRNPRECGTRGKTGLRAAFSFWLEAVRVQKPVVFLRAFLPVRLTRGRRPSARRPVAGGKVSRKPGFRLLSCLPAGPRESRISARPRPRPRPRVSRGAGFDVLTKWQGAWVETGRPFGCAKRFFDLSGRYRVLFPFFL